MYAGIIHNQATIEQIDQVADGGLVLRVTAPQIMPRVENGSSVNVAGVCLTARNIDAQGFSADVMPQTLSLTAIGDWKVGETVNVEPSLRVGDELGGHFVYGHIDNTAEVVSVQDDGNARLVTFEPPVNLMKWIVDQGSVAIDGVSLTVAKRTDTTFSVSLIPETLERTTLKRLVAGSHVNLEVDMIMKGYGATD